MLTSLLVTFGPWKPDEVADFHEHFAGLLTSRLVYSASCMSSGAHKLSDGLLEYGLRIRRSDVWHSNLEASHG